MADMEIVEKISPPSLRKMINSPECDLSNDSVLRYSSYSFTG